MISNSNPHSKISWPSWTPFLSQSSQPDTSFHLLSKISGENLPSWLLKFIGTFQLLLHMFLKGCLHCMGIAANTTAVIICYIYIKSFKEHSAMLVEGYVTIYKTFAEFISAIICLCYGLVEMDFFYTILGAVGILVGLCQKGIMLYSVNAPPERNHLTCIASTMSTITIFFVLFCSMAFYDIMVKSGVIPCASRFVTCVLPMIALSEAFSTRSKLSYFFSFTSDIIALVVLWWYCGHLSFKYFFVVPSVIGLLFTLIQYILEQIRKITTKENEKDIYRE